MKQVVVQAFCDLCDEDEQVEATAEVTHNGRLLDVCSRHERMVRDVQRRLEDLFAEGVEVEKPPPPARPRAARGTAHPATTEAYSTEYMRTCQEPGCSTRTSTPYMAPTRTALGQHVKSKHNKRLGDYEWTLGR